MTPPTLEAVNALKKILYKRMSLNEITLRSPFAQELVYGTLRYFLRLEKILQHLLHKSLSSRDQDIYVLLLTGLYQLIYLQQPPYSAVNETVHSAATLGKPWAKKLVNAILRNFIRKKATCLAYADKNPVSLYAHPYWFIEKIKDAWPMEWQEILTANNQHPPFTLRVNLLKTQRENYLPGELHPYNECGITLPTAQKTENLVGFTQGKVSVQDGAAQLAATLLDLQPKHYVLDACAAPGNKTAHLLEVQPTIYLTALEIQLARFETLKKNLQRLGLTQQVNLLLADATHPEMWWNKQLFDRILLDAPCSGTGVIRRHPDIKYFRHPKDIEATVVKQKNLLNTLWPLLKPTGKLLYVTCSILPEENHYVIKNFLAHHSNAKEIKLNVTWGITQAYGRQILPGIDNMDGFYYALLQKCAER